MPEAENQQDLAVQLAQMREQLRAVASSVEDIKTAVGQVVALDRTIAELSIHNQNLRKDIDLLWQRADTNKEKIEAAERATGAVDDKVEALTNRARGAMWVLGLLLGTFQAMMLGCMAWVFSHVNDADVMNKLQQQRLEQLERDYIRIKESKQ